MNEPGYRLTRIITSLKMKPYADSLGTRGGSHGPTARAAATEKGSMSILPRHTIFRRFAILLIAPLVAAVVTSPSPAMATLCGTTIATAWSTSTGLGSGTVTTNEGRFTAEGMDLSSDDGTSVFSGTIEDRPAEAKDTEKNGSCKIRGRQ